jgi:RNA polymerase sigma factor (sigma-70 family)
MAMTMKTSDRSDAQLVEWTLAGDRAAFATIVKRYQSLVCSITYNATGSLTLSEDLAQETFLAAWRQLSKLREPTRLRSWLCGITRFLVGKEYRREGREPLHAAESLDAIEEPHSLEASPALQAVSREEEAILWRALERIPGTYREPLILFYREEKSIERVAAELELSEDAVKQRLSRGRKLLHEEVIAFVEGTLRRTAPGQDFSSAVLAMLPAAQAATAGAGLAGKGATLVKSGSACRVAGALGTVCRPCRRHTGELAIFRGRSNRSRTPLSKALFLRHVDLLVGLANDRAIAMQVSASAIRMERPDVSLGNDGHLVVLLHRGRCLCNLLYPAGQVSARERLSRNPVYRRPPERHSPSDRAWSCSSASMWRLSPGSFTSHLRARDPLWAAIIAGIMAVLFVRAFAPVPQTNCSSVFAGEQLVTLPWPGQSSW